MKEQYVLLKNWVSWSLTSKIILICSQQLSWKTACSDELEERAYIYKHLMTAALRIEHVSWLSEKKMTLREERESFLTLLTHIMSEKKKKMMRSISSDMNFCVWKKAVMCDAWSQAAVCVMRILTNSSLKTSKTYCHFEQSADHLII